MADAVILIAPDSFKGSLSAHDVDQSVAPIGQGQEVKGGLGPGATDACGQGE
jgi:hypothetical protein